MKLAVSCSSIAVQNCHTQCCFVPLVQIAGI